MSNLIKKLIFWFAEIGTIVLTFMMVRSEWIIWKDRAELSWYIGMIVTVYIISVIELIVMRIFNFLHKFDDYDDFGEFFKRLLYGPITLVHLAVCHFANICGYIYGMITRGANSGYATPSYKAIDDFYENASQTDSDENNGAVYDKRNETMFTNMVEKKAKAIASRPPIGDFIHSSTVHVAWEYGFANVSVAPWGKIIFSGTIVFKNSISFDTQEYDESYIEDCVNETADLLMERMSDAIEEVRREYKGYDKSYSIEANLSYKTVNMRLR